MIIEILPYLKYKFDCNQNWKVSGSNPTRRFVRLVNAASLRGSRWTSGRIRQIHVKTSLPESLFNKVIWNFFEKETQAQMFSCNVNNII